MKKFLARYHHLLLVLILSFAFVTRMYQVHLPERYVFDEVYHAVTAKLINRNDPWAYQWWNPPVEPDTAVDWLHPPLAKYTQALSMHVFGENSFGWRFSSVVFGVLVIFATYKLTLTLFKKPNLALLAAGLASLDGLLLVQSRVAMNDIHVTFFILVTLIFGVRYLRLKWAWLSKKTATKNQAGAVFFWSLMTGVAGGLAMGSKWSGLFVVGWLIVCDLATWLWLWLKLKRWRPQQLQLVVFNLVSLALLPLAIYVLSYIQMFSLGHSLMCREQRPIQTQCYYEQLKLGNQVIFEGYVSHFVELHRQIWLYQTHLTATHPYQSRPWQWFLDTRPVWYHVAYSDDGKIANIYAFGNPVLFWLGDLAILATVVYLIYSWWYRKKWSWPLVFLLLSYFLVWLPWMRSPRIMFFYHYTPAVPLLAINLAYWFHYLWQRKTVVSLSRGSVLLGIGLIALVFALWYPLWTGIPVPTAWANRLYFSLKSWK